MKKLAFKLACLLSLLCLLSFPTDGFAQSWLKKLSKGVENYYNQSQQRRMQSTDEAIREARNPKNKQVETHPEDRFANLPEVSVEESKKAMDVTQASKIIESISNLTPIGEYKINDHGEKHVITHKIFKREDGGFLSLFMYDENNFALAFTSMGTDPYSGEEVVSQYLHYNQKIFYFQRVNDTDTVVFNYSTEPKGIVVAQKHGQPLVMQIVGDNFNYITQLFQNASHHNMLYNMCLNENRSNLGTYRIFVGGKWQVVHTNDYAKKRYIYNKDILGDYGFNFVNPETNDVVLIGKLWNKDYRYMPIKQLELPSGIKLSIPMPIHYSGKITNVEENGKIVVLNFDNGDYLKLSTLAEKIMEGKLTTEDGELTYDVHNNLLTLKNKYPLELKVQNVDERGFTSIEIPVNSSLSVGPYNGMYSAVCTRVLDTSLESKERGEFGFFSIIDPDGNIIVENNKWVGFDDFRRKAREEEKNRQANARALETKKINEIIDKYKNKYGEKYVSAAITGQIIVGAPLTMVKEMFRISEIHSSTGYKVYKVYLSQPTINVAEGTITPRTGMFSNGRTITISVSNGVVRSVTQ